MRHLLLALGLMTTALLAACGGGHDDDAPQAADPLAAVPSTANASSAGLVAYLKALVRQAPEDREPLLLDGAAPPGDDAGEPQTLG